MDVPHTGCPPILFSRLKLHPVSKLNLAIADARRRGRHTYRAHWDLAAGADEADLVELTQRILSWCRGIVGTCRRPYGIAQFDLRLDFAVDPRGGRTAMFRALLPQKLYEDEFVLEVHGIATRAGTQGRLLRISAALFSWGDAADSVLPKTRSYTSP